MELMDVEEQKKNAERLGFLRTALILCLCLVMIFVVALAIKYESNGIVKTFQSITSDTASKKLALQKNMSNIKSLKEKLTIKYNLARSKKQYFLDQNELAKDHILEVCRQGKITNLEQAVNNLVIRNEMKLIFRRNEYIKRINELTRLEFSGISELDYYYKKAADELMLLSINQHGEIEKLSAEINLIYKKYLPEAGELVLDVKNIENPPLDKIWEDIMAAEKGKEKK